MLMSSKSFSKWKRVVCLELALLKVCFDAVCEIRGRESAVEPLFSSE